MSIEKERQASIINYFQKMLVKKGAYGLLSSGRIVAFVSLRHSGETSISIHKHSASAGCW